MISAQTGAGAVGTEGRGTPCADCDPDLLDHLKCRGKGIQAQADYNKAHEDAMSQARTKYDGARSTYGTARSAARPDVDDLRKQLTQVIDQLKCLVDNEYQIRLLDQAFRQVERRLRKCDPNEGCTFNDDCDFDDAVRDCKPEDVAAVIADIERRAAAAAVVFEDLIAEPTNLSKRVADLKAEVDAIVTKMASDSRSVDFLTLYAAALVARDHLDAIWRGFENVNAYVDCLCRTLTCQIKGYAAVSQLKGLEAVEQCHRDQEAAACQLLQKQTADEVIAEYIRLKSQERHEREESERREESGYVEREGERGNGRDRYGSDERGRS